MLVGVSGGVQATTGYRVEIIEIAKKANVPGLTVYWKLHAPKPGQPLAKAPTHPAAVALVEQTPGPVQFKQMQK